MAMKSEFLKKLPIFAGLSDETLLFLSCIIESPPLPHL
jgi:hypothetical protein